MDLREYYQKLHEVQSSIEEDFVVVSSLKTGEGGKPGILTEVPKLLAARLVSEGRAELARPEQTTVFRESIRDAREEADALAEAAKMRVVVVPSETRRQRRDRESGSE